jgi:hypothetical protein
LIISGIVVKINKESLSVMTKNMEFIKIKNNLNVKIGQYIYFSTNDIIETNKNYKIPRVIVAASIIIVLLSVGFFKYININEDNFAYVEFETDSSIEFVVDTNFEIISYRAFNDNGEKLINENILENKSLDTVINQLYKTNLNSIHGDSTLYISVCSANSNVNQSELRDKSKTFFKELESNDLKFKTYLYNSEIKNIANEYNMSGIRYLLFEYLNYKEDSMTFNSLNNYNINALLKENNIENLDILINGAKIQENEIKEFAINEKETKSATEVDITPKVTTKTVTEDETTKTETKTSTDDKNKEDEVYVLNLDKGTIKVEAEDINYFGAELKNNISGFTGNGYLQGFKGKDKYFSLNLFTQEEAQYDMWIRYKNINPRDDKDTDVYLNGENLNDAINYIKLNQNSEWNQIDYELNLNKGENSLKLLSLDNDYSLIVDSIKFIYVEY